jgi:hypothetical protein
MVFVFFKLQIIISNFCKGLGVSDQVIGIGSNDEDEDASSDFYNSGKKFNFKRICIFEFKLKNHNKEVI